MSFQDGGVGAGIGTCLIFQIKLEQPSAILNNWEKDLRNKEKKSTHLEPVNFAETRFGALNWGTGGPQHWDGDEA